MNPALSHQLERIRAMSADEKVRISHDLWIEARAVLTAGLCAPVALTVRRGDA